MLYEFGRNYWIIENLVNDLNRLFGYTNATQRIYGNILSVCMKKKI